MRMDSAGRESLLSSMNDSDEAARCTRHTHVGERVWWSSDTTRKRLRRDEAMYSTRREGEEVGSERDDEYDDDRGGGWVRGGRIGPTIEQQEEGRDSALTPARRE